MAPDTVSTMRFGSVRGLAQPLFRCVLGTSGIRDRSKFTILDRFLDAGGNCIDTARVYGDGSCETSVGEWIRRAQPDNLVVLGKGAHPPRCRPEAVATDLTRSLDALGVDVIDLYMLHRDDPAIPVGEFVDALEIEVVAGRIRAYGASNWRQPRLAQAQAYAAARGMAGMAALSNHLSLAKPVEPLYPGCETVSESYLSYLRAAGIALFPWSAQGRGFFADAPAESLDPNVARCWGVPENYARRDRARRLASGLGVRPLNVALAYVLAQPVQTFPIIGPQTDEELTVALAGVETTLDDDQVRWLENGGRPPAGSRSASLERSPR